jgi:SH3 domain-containing protein/outer membrane protein with glycine zipper
MKRAWAQSSVCVGLSIVLVSVHVAGCAGTMAGQTSGQQALICGAGGAVVGAAAGAAIGSRARNSGTGALIGAGIGALVGALAAGTACFAMAEYRSQQVKSYEETRQAVNYQASQGEVLQITRYEITPGAASPGMSVSFNATYLVMTPNPEQEVAVTETRIVKFFDPKVGDYRELGRAVNPVTVKSGTRQADGKWEIRSGVAEGRYLVQFDVAKAERHEVKELPLLVTKSEATLRTTGSQVVEAAPSGAGGPKVTDSAAPSGGGSLAALGEPQPKAPTVAVAGGASTAPEGQARYFVASKVVGKGNVREGPGTTHKIIGAILPAERFLVLERSAQDTNRWYKIRLENGREGWVASSLGEEVGE